MNRYKIFFLVSICLSFACSKYNNNTMNINNANGNYYIVQYALQFLGRNTSDFPNGKFIMQILYGHVDVPWTIKDLIKEFGESTSITDFSLGNIMISKSNVAVPLIGIVMDQTFTIIPIEGEHISIISSVDLNSYFPDGYVMKKSQDYYFEHLGNIQKATLNNSIFCKQCDTIIRTIAIPDPPDFYNQFILFYMTSRDSHIFI